MKKLILGMATISLLSMGVVAQASVTTIKFTGSDIMADAPGSINMSGTPVIGDGYIAIAPGVIRTYGATGSPTMFNNWLGGLGKGEGISQFNLWLQDGASNQAAMWGETLALKDAYSSDIFAFASPGWTASVYTLVDADWGPAWTGRKLITFTADSSDFYLRPGNDVTFGFTADIIGNAGATGPNYQMWVGSDQIVGRNGESYFQRAVGAQAVPGPAAILPFLGGLLLAARRRRK